MFVFFFFNDTATTEIYTLSLHDALPIFEGGRHGDRAARRRAPGGAGPHPDRRLGRRGRRQGRRDRGRRRVPRRGRSEEHTSELQSRQYLVCRLLLEKKKKKNTTH